MKNTVDTNSDLYFKKMPSPIGELGLIAANDCLQRLLWPSVQPPDNVQRDNNLPILNQSAQQINEYFAGKRVDFDLELDPQGTPFQLKVWEHLMLVAYGLNISYSHLARLIGKPRSARAVGAALGKNPIPIIIPCHRVLARDFSLGGFSGDLEIKSYLLKHEADLVEATKPN